MLMQTISLKFANAMPQALAAARLEEVCAQLMDQGAASALRVEAIFPGHADPMRASLFTVEAEGACTDLASLIDAATPELDYVQSAPSRRWLRRAA